jgi:hypothetical protein
VSEKEIRREILHAIIECQDRFGETIVGRVDHAARLRDAVFAALFAKGLLRVEEESA